MNGFGETAQKLARNPLGIIALFIVLVDFFASLVAGPFGAHLDVDQVWVLIGFLVGFPILVFLAFCWLIVWHNQKLYAPGDYRSDEAFLRTLTPQEQAARVTSELREAGLALEPVFHSLVEADPDRPKPSLSLYDPRRAPVNYILAEDLVLRLIESELGTAIRRQAGFGTGAATVEFDGVIPGDEYTAIDVKYRSRTNIGTSEVSDTVAKAARASRLLTSTGQARRFRFIFALVTYGDERTRANLRERVERLVGDVPFEVEVRVYNFDDLRLRFGLPAVEAERQPSQTGWGIGNDAPL